MQYVSHKYRTALLLSLWAASVAVILHVEPLLAKISGDGHSICGAWGCGPPLSSLIVWHGFVASVAIPTAVLLAKRYPLLALKYGRLVASLIALFAATFVVANTGMWWRNASEFARGFLMQRVLFCTVAFTDAPVIPLVVAGVAYWACGRRSQTPTASVDSTSDVDGRTRTEQLEDLGDIAVGKVNTST